MDDKFWRGKKVLITGNTGFKGSWLGLWLYKLGADVRGYSLPAPTAPSMYELCRLDRLVRTHNGDVRDGKEFASALNSFGPEIIFHMAAQALVLDSYKLPAETYDTNIMGTVNVLEAVRRQGHVKAVVVVTSDKCYDNKERLWGYKEEEPLGGYDPYSSSKACAELVTAAYRNSFFNPDDFSRHGTAVASVRAGNVIGGGDWAHNRLVPDCVRSFLKNEKVLIRHPNAVRPWQHALSPLSGYLMLARKLYLDGAAYAQAWNFGPDAEDVKSVEMVVSGLCRRWGHAEYSVSSEPAAHEAQYLTLDSGKARTKLGWLPKWHLDYSLDKIIEWTKAYKDNKNLQDLSLRQIEEYSR